MNHFDQTYTHNLNALKHSNSSLYLKLTAFGDNERYEAVPNDGMPYNILDTVTNTLLYENTLTHTSEMLEIFYPLREHLFLYFFGIGNGHVAKELLKNAKHTLTIIEPSLELLFVAFHLENFSVEILSKQVFFFLLEDMDLPRLVPYFDGGVKIYYARLYNLYVSSPYYETYHSVEYIKANKLLVDTIEFVIINAGNSSEDSLIGLDHHIYNLPHMVAGTKFQTFIKGKNSNTVIMVSTGPSLTKQLPLLKKIQGNATIICADSALGILYNHAIIPDICVSLERIEGVAELFRKLPTEYKQNVIFVRASLQHKGVYETIENCHDILVTRPLPYNRLFGLDDYGTLCSGTSVANMAHELSAYMNFDTCIIIGQDLAYGRDGTTHSKGHIHGEKDVSVQNDFVEVPAYGGEGFVKTNSIWALFRNGLIQTVDTSKKKMTTVNATEGGANIPGTIEMPFKDAIIQYIPENGDKKPLLLIQTPQKEAIKHLKLANKNILTLRKEGVKLQKLLEKAFVILAKKCKKLENKNEEEQLNCFDDDQIIYLLDLISKTRNALEENFYFKNFYWHLIQSSVMHYELDLAVVKCTPVNTQEENKSKALKWIYNHFHYFFTIAGAVQEIIYIFDKAQKESLKELPERLKFFI